MNVLVIQAENECNNRWHPPFFSTHTIVQVGQLNELARNVLSSGLVDLTIITRTCSQELLSEIRELNPAVPVAFRQQHALVLCDIHQAGMAKMKVETYLARVAQAEQLLLQGQQQSLLDTRAGIGGATYRQRLLLRVNDKFRSIQTTEVAYFNTSGRYTETILHDGSSCISDYTISDLEALLDPKDFFRASRSVILSFPSIRTISLYPGGRMKVVVHPRTGKDIIISREKTATFKKWLGE